MGSALCPNRKGLMGERAENAGMTRGIKIDLNCAHL